MNRRFVTQILLTFFIVSISSYVTFNVFAENGYTTTVTEQFATTLTSVKTVTLDTTVSSYTTRTKTTETVIETLQMSMAPQTVIIPTRIIITEMTARTLVTIIYRTTTIIEDFTFTTRTNIKILRLDQILTQSLANARAINTYVTATIIAPRTVTSWITSYGTIEETETISKEEMSTRTTTELITLTLENVYTSVHTPEESSILTSRTGFDIGTVLSNNLIWVLIVAILCLVIALAIRSRRTKSHALKDADRAYCVNCGKPIASGVKYCPKCGATQK